MRAVYLIRCIRSNAPRHGVTRSPGPIRRTSFTFTERRLQEEGDSFSTLLDDLRARCAAVCPKCRHHRARALLALEKRRSISLGTHHAHALPCVCILTRRAGSLLLELSRVSRRTIAAYAKTDATSVATTQRPHACVGEVAHLTAVDVTSHGAFAQGPQVTNCGA